MPPKIPVKQKKYKNSTARPKINSEIELAAHTDTE